MLTYPWKCTVLHCNHLGNTWKPLVLMTQHFDYCLSASEGDNQSVRSSAPVVSRCFPGGYNVKLYISRGRLAWWLLALLHSDRYWHQTYILKLDQKHSKYWIYKFGSTWAICFQKKDYNAEWFVANILEMNICRTCQNSPILLFVAAINNLT